MSTANTATLYGIKNCDSVKKARKWLETEAIDYRFHDFRSDGLTAQQIETWLAALGWESLINKRSTSWKQLSPQQRDKLDNNSATALILDTPTLIKRPLLSVDGEYHLGFKADNYSKLFK